MDFFGMGMGEILLILLIALIIFGPSRIVEISRSLGKMMYNLRKATSELSSQVNKEIDEQRKAASEVVSEIKKEVSQINREIEGHTGPSVPPPENNPVQKKT